MNARKRHTPKLVIAVPLLAALIPLGLQYRQARLDSALVAAIISRNTAQVASLLDQGANANATDDHSRSTTFQALIAEFCSRIQGGANRPERSAPALMLACTRKLKVNGID